MQVVGVGFVIGVIQDSVETALNSSGDVMFAATAEYAQWKKNGKSLPTFLGGKTLDLHTAHKLHTLDRLASSHSLWEQRISIVCTWKTSHQGDPTWCLRYAEKLLHHRHDLMHKAVGWMLREMGKRVSMDLLRDFLRQHAATMPRTALRYAIEKMPYDERRYWMEFS